MTRPKPGSKRKGLEGNTKDKTVKVYQRSKIDYQLKLAKPDWTPRQQELIDIIKHHDTKATMIKGPAGSSKTFITLAIALELLNSGRIKEIILVRSIVESGAISMGSLPGDSDEKMSPFMMPFNDKLAELLPPQDIKQLHTDKRIKCVPVNHMRGRQFDASFIIADECQNMLLSELQTVVTRVGKYTKIVLCGDTEQVDFVKGKRLESGYKDFYNWYDNDISKSKGVYSFKFGIEDIKREEIVKFFVEQYDLMRHHLNSADYRPGEKK